MNRVRAIAIMLFASAVLIGGCSNGEADGSVTPEQMRGRLAERLDATDQQAACITDYLLEAYTADQVALLYDDGVAALPQSLWDPYFTSANACLTSDQLDP